MRFAIAAAVAALVLPIQSLPASATGTVMTQQQTIDLSAATKAKKAVKKKRAPKVEYMRAVPAK